MPSVTDLPPVPLDTKPLELRTALDAEILAKQPWKIGDDYPLRTEFSVL